MNFKRYDESSDTWIDSHYIRGTATDTLTLPQTIYGDGTNATLTLKGNTVQNGTPTPANPVPVVGVGTLEGNDYKIPILNNSQTTNVYLGEVQTVRLIKKYELTGNEDWRLSGTVPGAFWCNNFNSDYDNSLYNIISCLCTHYEVVPNKNGFSDLNNGCICLYCYNQTATNYHELYIRDTTISTLEDFKTYLSQQYAANTPVTVYYVLATAETATVNEPLRKIGDYADTLSTSIPTTDGANVVDVLTTLKPSEVSANYHGWHSVASVHERSGGQWD